MLDAGLQPVAGYTVQVTVDPRLERGLAMLAHDHAEHFAPRPPPRTAVSPRPTAAPVHLCRILRITYHKSQKTIISAREDSYAVLGYRYLPYCPVSSRTWPCHPWLAVFADPRWPTWATQVPGGATAGGFLLRSSSGAAT